MEIIIIIIIIAVIMMVLGGLGPTGLVYETNYKALNESQFTCDRIVWTSGPAVEDGKFHGTISQACEVSAVGNGGIPALEEYLADRVLQKAAKVYATNYTTRADGMEGVSYDVAVRGEADGDSIELRGTTQLVSDGAIELLHTFKANPKDAQKANRWLRGVASSMHVSSSLRPNWYRVVLSHEAIIAKPALVSSSRFRSMVAEKLEKKVAEEAKNVLTSVANQL